MNALNGLFSGILIIETFLIVLIAVYAWRKRNIAGAMPLFLLCIASSFYSIGYSMELMSATLSEVNFWSKFQYLGLPFVPVLCLALSLAITRKKEPIPINFIIIAAIPGAITCLLRLTSESHQLFYGSMQLISNGYFNVLNFEKGPWYYIHFVYFLLCAAFAIFWYWKAYRASSGYVKNQFVIMMIASVMPFISIGINLANVFPFQMDSGSFFILFDYLLFYYGIFRYNMLDLIPLSRDRVFEWMQDGVMVLDIDDHLMDYNQAASCIFPILHEAKTGELIQVALKGCKSFLAVLEAWQAHKLIAEPSDEERLLPQDYEFEIVYDHLQEIQCYKARFKTLTEKNSDVGTVIMVTDITKAKALLRTLEKTAQLDALTQINNRRHFIDLADIQMKRLERHDGNGVLVLFDLDHFKDVNDRYGHQAGDLVLRTIAQKTLHNLRNVDILGRYGGEEFIVFLPDTEIDQARQVMERIRIAFEREPILWHDAPIHVTASFGMTLQKDSALFQYRDFDTMVKLADEAMYSAKQLGRNRIEVH